MAEAAPERYFAAMAEEGLRAGNLRFSIQKRFEGIDFSGRAVLDIGAGAGGMSFYAAVAGAARVVALEPEAAGSSRGVRSTFERRRQRLGADQVSLRPETLQEFDPGDQRFDVIISMASINHLDEAACKELHRDPEARRVYREILGKLAEMAAPGADLVVSDCARRNVFPDLGLPNPILRTIEWEKHQSPSLWAALLAEVGFRDPRIRWSSFNTLRRPAQWLLGNRVGAYLTTSAFCLAMKREGAAAAKSSEPPRHIAIPGPGSDRRERIAGRCDQHR
jgi:SAM-dependent methyltransferase